MKNVSEMTLEELKALTEEIETRRAVLHEEQKYIAAWKNAISALHDFLDEYGVFYMTINGGDYQFDASDVEMWMSTPGTMEINIEND